MKLSTLNFFTVFFLLFTGVKGYAQTPVTEWHKCLGSNYSEYAHCVQPTSDGGFIIVGETVGHENGDVTGHHGNISVPDLWVVKLDKEGNLEWQKNLGGNDSDVGSYIIQTADGGYIVAGGAASIGCGMTGNHGGFDFWIVKLSSKGNVIWQKTYGGSKQDIASSIALSADGGYFVAGHTMSDDGDVKLNHGGMDYWIIKVDATGNLVWQKSLGGSDFEGAETVQATADGGCVVAGSTHSLNGDVTGNHGSGDYWVVKLDNNGNIQWQKALGGSMSEFADCIQVTKDGGYIVSGTANSHDGDVTGNHGSYDAWIVKLNANGNIVWQKSYGGSTNESAHYIQNTPDGGYVFTGNSLSSDGDVTCNAGFYDVLVMKINSLGAIEWQKTLGGTDIDEGQCVQPLSDGTFIVAGYTASPDIAGYHTPAGGLYDDKFDYWVIKLSAPVTTVPAPVVKIDPATAIVCAGNQATVRASLLYGGVNPFYQWMKNGIPAGSNSPVFTNVNFNDGDLVSCVVKNGNICENSILQGSDAVSIKLKNNTPDPEIKIAADNTHVCNCATTTLTATVSNAGGSPRYQWLVNGNNAGINSPVFISHTLKNGDVISCSYSDNSVCTATGSVISNTIKMGDGNAAPSVTIAATADTICKGSAVNFTATALNAGTNPVYQWKVNNVNTGANSSLFTSSSLSDGDIISCSIKSDPLFVCATVTSANSNSIAIHVTNKDVPSVSIAASAETVCAGSAVIFTATARHAGANPTYQWKINGVNTGTNDKIFTNSSLSNNDIVTCSISIDPLFTCALANGAISQNITMKVNDGTPPSVSISASAAIVCPGETITFTARAEHAGTNPSYEWILNNTTLPGGSQVYSSNQLKNGDRLFCRIVPGAGACSSIADSSNIFIAVINDTPVVYISPADTTIGPGMQILLHSSVSGNISSFEWSPADKLVNPLSSVVQTVVLNKNTSYTLTVVNDKGCRATATSVIKVFTELYMPNAFTPNDDGVNDLFRIPPDAAITLKEFSIYNRWGTRVFATKNTGEGWNGRSHGKKQDAGVYIYYIKAIINSKDVFIKGSFILVR